MYDRNRPSSLADPLWNRYKDIASLLQLFEKVTLLPDCIPKEQLLIEIQSIVPQATASDTTLLKCEIDDLRNQITSLKNENGKLLSMIEDHDVAIDRGVTLALRVAHNNLSWLGRRLVDI